MVVRKIVKIDEELCNGCGLCVPACHEGAIQIVDGKARVIDDKLCDGLGDCLGECPLGAITIEEREAAEYDEEAVLAKRQSAKKINHSEGCPGVRMMDLEEKSTIKSQLKNWPVQLMLIPEKASYFDKAELMVTADCVPFAYPDFHQDLLQGRTVVTGCPKLDDAGFYLDKLTAVIRNNRLKGITVVFMEVPCCTGIARITEEALIRSGKDIPLQKVRISISGEKTQVD